MQKNFEGVKYDAGKPMMRLVPPRALRETAKVLTFGASKYSPENWRQLKNLDESDCHVLAHAICDLMFVLENIIMSEQENDSF
jgi:hypothetical protein